MQNGLREKPQRDGENIGSTRNLFQIEDVRIKRIMTSRGHFFDGTYLVHVPVYDKGVESERLISVNEKPEHHPGRSDISKRNR